MCAHNRDGEPADWYDATHERKSRMAIRGCSARCEAMWDRIFLQVFSAKPFLSQCDVCLVFVAFATENW